MLHHILSVSQLVTLPKKKRYKQRQTTANNTCGGVSAVSAWTHNAQYTNYYRILMVLHVYCVNTLFWHWPRSYISVNDVFMPNELQCAHGH